MPFSKVLSGGSLLVLASQALAVPVVSEPTTTFTSVPTATPSQIPNTNVTSHGPYEGTPTTTGALSTEVLAASVAPLPPQDFKLAYPADGKLHRPQPAP